MLCMLCHAAPETSARHAPPDAIPQDSACKYLLMQNEIDEKVVGKRRAVRNDDKGTRHIFPKGNRDLPVSAAGQRFNENGVQDPLVTVRHCCQHSRVRLASEQQCC